MRDRNEVPLEVVALDLQSTPPSSFDAAYVEDAMSDDAYMLWSMCEDAYGDEIPPKSFIDSCIDEIEEENIRLYKDGI